MAGNWWLRAVACGLAAAGLDTSVASTAAGAELTAVAHQPGRRDVDVLLDDGRHAEIRFWVSHAVTPLDIAIAISRAIGALEPVTGPIPLVPPTPVRPPLRVVSRYDGAVTDRTGETAMAAAQDRITEEPAADTPRLEAGRVSDLRDRLERLPPGHPSSVRNDDGTRKPAPPGLSALELPLPDEHDRRLPPDGSWEWKGRTLTPDQSKAGDQALERCRTAEGRDADGNYGDHGLTPAMRRIEAQLDHGHLVEGTEQFALKSPARFKEKLADSIKAEPDKSPEELANEIHDGIRYTFIIESEKYVAGVQAVQDSIEEQGFELGVVKNTWSHPEYKGINTRWHDHEAAVKFEIQFHTRESWEAKQETHKAYEKINNPGTQPGEREKLRAYQREISSRVSVPPDVDMIVDYRREGW
jgi:hypothetical protein